MITINCRRLDSNPGPLVLEATALSFVQQILRYFIAFVATVSFYVRKSFVNFGIFYHILRVQLFNVVGAVRASVVGLRVGLSSVKKANNDENVKLHFLSFFAQLSDLKLLFKLDWSVQSFKIRRFYIFI